MVIDVVVSEHKPQRSPWEGKTKSSNIVSYQTFDRKTLLIQTNLQIKLEQHYPFLTKHKLLLYLHWLVSKKWGIMQN